MFFAMWLVCVAGSECLMVEEHQQSLFKEETACEQYAEGVATQMLQNLKARGFVARIAFRCEVRRDA
jgi:Na+/alanine symporter